MKSVSNMLYLILIASLALTACEDKKEQPTKSRLDLKEFQILRENEDGTEIILSGETLNAESTFNLTDRIATEFQPEGITLNTDVECKNASMKDYVPISLATSFDDPIELYKILPKEAFSWINYPDNNSVFCSIKLKALDNKGNKYIRRKVIKGLIEFPADNLNLEIMKNGNTLKKQKDEQFELIVTELNQYRLNTVSLEKAKSSVLYCERFSLSAELSSADSQLELTEFNFSKIGFNIAGFNGRNHNVLPKNQNCRLLLLNEDSRTIGVSSVFKLIRQQPKVVPEILEISRNVDGKRNNISSEDVENQSVFYFSDKITSSGYSENQNAKTIARCWETDSKGQIIIEQLKTTESIFRGKVDLWSTLPEVAFSRSILDESQNTKFQCTVELYFSIGSGDYILSPMKISGQVKESHRDEKMLISIKSKTMPTGSYPQAGPSKIAMSEIHNNVVLDEARSGFDRIKLVCETFEISTRLSNANTYDLINLNFNYIEYHGGPQNAQLYKSVPAQTCRFLAYREGNLYGFSRKFELTQPVNLPTVEFTIDESSSYLGSPHGSWQTSFNNNLTLGHIKISNLNSAPIAVGLLQDFSPLAKIQWNSVPFMSGNLEEYGMIYETPVLMADGFIDSDWHKNQTHIFWLEPYEVVKLPYLVRLEEQCHVYGSFENAALGSQPVHGGGTFGLNIELVSPKISVLSSANPRDPKGSIRSGKQEWELPKGSIKRFNYIETSTLTEQVFNGRYKTGTFRPNAVVDNCKLGSSTVNLTGATFE